MSRIPFWERRAGGGPVTKRLAEQQRLQGTGRSIAPSLIAQAFHLDGPQQPSPEALHRAQELERDRTVQIRRGPVKHVLQRGFDITPTHDAVSQLESSYTMVQGLGVDVQDEGRWPR